ncbi:MAG: DUF5753 domain-containing protein [Umezawaea sp.]
MASGSTRGKRSLGAKYQALMTKYGVSVPDIVKLIGTSRPGVFNLLAGENRPRKPTFVALLSVFPDLTDEERDELWAAWNAADDDDGVVIQHAAKLPKTYVRFRRDERVCVLERTLDADLVPGLLQTPEYAEGVAQSSWRLLSLTDAEWSEKAPAERKERSDLLTRPNPLNVRALIHVKALENQVSCRGVSAADLMARQYDHLLEVGALPNVEIRALSKSVGAYGFHNGALTLLNFPDSDYEPLSAYIDSAAGLMAVKDLEQVQALSGVWDDASELALSAEETAEFIRQRKARLV